MNAWYGVLAAAVVTFAAFTGTVQHLNELDSEVKMLQHPTTTTVISTAIPPPTTVPSITCTINGYKVTTDVESARKLHCK